MIAPAQTCYLSHNVDGLDNHYSTSLLFMLSCLRSDGMKNKLRQTFNVETRVVVQH